MQKVRYFVQYNDVHPDQKNPFHVNMVNPVTRQSSFLPVGHVDPFYGDAHLANWPRMEGGYSEHSCEQRVAEGIGKEIKKCEARKLLTHHPDSAHLVFYRYVDADGTPHV